MRALRSQHGFLAFALLGCTCLSALTGCGGSSQIIPDLHYDSGIQGQVTDGPLAPVAQQGQANTAPLSGEVITVLTSNGTETARATTDNSGNYKIYLVAGTYQVQGLAYRGYQTFPKPPAPQTIVVPAHQFVTVNVSYDTGIR